MAYINVKLAGDKIDWSQVAKDNDATASKYHKMDQPAIDDEAKKKREEEYKLQLERNKLIHKKPQFGKLYINPKIASDYGHRINIGDPNEGGATMTEVRVEFANPKDKNVIGVFYLNCYGNPANVHEKVAAWMSKHYSGAKVPNEDYSSKSTPIDHANLPADIEKV
jgi:hypothetical protein